MRLCDSTVGVHPHAAHYQILTYNRLGIFMYQSNFETYGTIACTQTVWSRSVIKRQLVPY